MTQSRVLKVAARRILLGSLALAWVFVLVGCGKGPEDKPLSADGEFSVNVMPVPAFWPRENMDWPEDAAERKIRQDAWAKHGSPDFFRIVHTFDGRIVVPRELDPGHRMAGRRPQADIEWIYWDEDLVLQFKGNEVIESPIPDMIRTLCVYGDPNDIKSFPEKEGERVAFTYYDHGKTFSFVNGKLVDTYEFKPMTGFNMKP